MTHSFPTRRSSDLFPHESKRESGVSISSLVPMQPVRSMPASVEFYEKLGFGIEVRRDDWGWARLRCGDCRVMLDQSINLHAGIPRIADRKSTRLNSSH